MLLCCLRRHIGAKQSATRDLARVNISATGSFLPRGRSTTTPCLSRVFSAAPSDQLIRRPVPPTELQLRPATLATSRGESGERHDAAAQTSSDAFCLSTPYMTSGSLSSVWRPLRTCFAHETGPSVTDRLEMVTAAMKGFIPAPKGRVRTPVGHKYLEALQSKVCSAAETATSPSPTPEHKSPGLNLLVLGVTAGMAMEDIDFALCRFTQESPEAPLCLDIVQYDSVVIPSKIRTDILSMLREDAAPPSMLAQMDAEVGHTFANAIHIFAHRHGIAVDDIDLIGSGGQLITLTGTPPKGQHRSNMCLGEGAVISAKTGVTTVSDYRTAEQAVGRQGAPLFAYLVGLLLHHPTRLQICITIGCITTVCFIPPDNRGGIDAMYDWDTGPGMCMIDAAYRSFGYSSAGDQSTLPMNGDICHDVVEELLNSDHYLASRPPKTTANEIYGDALAMKIISMCGYRGCSEADTIATLTRFTSASIVQQMLQYGPGREAINNADIVIDGRGMSNRQLVADLQNEFPGARFCGFDKTGVPCNGKKAVGFAMQAMEAVLGRALPVPTNADVRRPNTITGKLAPGLRWREVIEKSVAFGGTGRGWEGLPEVRELIVKRRGER